MCDELRCGKLVELMPGQDLKVPLYWHQWKIRTPLTRLLSDAIVNTAHRWLDLPAD
jgi:LysR family transcriptional regulator (chromosome initiation inhibitor)